ncbi:hypothetical protein V3C99_005382, partial [Haemonchus contortus]|uniref:GPI mannosyltransferase 2 n=1 Tax=Haemonchus contortus TaxID=6289 RepID=A0A7I4XTH0_HAECO
SFQAILWEKITHSGTSIPAFLARHPIPLLLLWIASNSVFVRISPALIPLYCACSSNIGSL